tara:strand:+ start:452 stop:736 length:285 start_codon:yes stop_codon:yes gene_type:complete
MLAWTAAVKLNPNHPTTVSSTEKDPTKVICRKKVVTRPTEAEADLNLKIGKKAPGIVMVVAMPVQQTTQCFPSQLQITRVIHFSTFLNFASAVS